MSRCKSCGAAVEWAKTVNGKAIPLDVGAFENGNLTVIGGLARKRNEEDAGRHLPARRSHFSSCPQDGIWRKRP